MERARFTGAMAAEAKEAAASRSAPETRKERG